MTTRLFFAIEVSDEWRQQLTALIKTFHTTLGEQYIHWTSSENLHLTLRFLGTCRQERLPIIEQHIKKAIKDTKPFSLEATHVHLFPNPTDPHIIALGIKPNTDLFTLQQTIDQAVMSAGFGAEKYGFFPHITLGRIPPRLKVHLPDNIDLKLISLPVREIILFNSAVEHEKRVYSPIQRFNLTASILPRVCVGAIVKKDHKILLVKRKNPPHKGLWAIPGGKVEPGETLQQAAEREILEETGLIIHAKEPLFVFDLIERDENNFLQLHYVIIDLEADYVSGEITINEESEEARWVNVEECKELGLTPSTEKFLLEKIGGEGGIRTHVGL